MTNQQPESWTRDMAQLLNHMNTLKNTSTPPPTIYVENSLEEEVNPNYCMFTAKVPQPEMPWHAGFSFNKKQDYTSTESSYNPQIMYQEEHQATQPKMYITTQFQQDQSLLSQPTIHIQESSTPDPEEDPFDSFLNDFDQDTNSFLEEADILFNMPTIEHSQSSTLSVEQTSHTRRASFGNAEMMLNIPEVAPERPRSPKRTRRKSFGDLEALESELEGIKRCRFDEQFQQAIADKNHHNVQQRRGSSMDDACLQHQHLSSSPSQGFEIRYQPVLMMNNVPVQVLDENQLNPSLMISTSMDSNRLSPHMGGFMQVSPSSPYSYSPVSPGDESYNMINNLMLNCDFQSNNHSVSPSGRRMVPVKRRNNKPSPADKYLSQFVMKQS